MRKGHGSPEFVTDLRPVFHETLTSWASHGGHSLPGPPWDARDPAPRTAAPRGTPSFYTAACSYIE